MNQADTKTSALPDVADMVTLPGAYSDNDPGIFYQGAYDPSAPYVFPGPNVISAAPPPAGTSTSIDPTSTDPTSTADPEATTTALPPCGGYSKKMKRVVRRDSHAQPAAKRHTKVVVIKREARPQVISRVMRGISQ